jgi:hypothetical protein
MPDDRTTYRCQDCGEPVEATIAGRCYQCVTEDDKVAAARDAANFLALLVQQRRAERRVRNQQGWVEFPPVRGTVASPLYRMTPAGEVLPLDKVRHRNHTHIVSLVHNSPSGDAVLFELDEIGQVAISADTEVPVLVEADDA